MLGIHFSSSVFFNFENSLILAFVIRHGRTLEKSQSFPYSDHDVQKCSPSLLSDLNFVFSAYHKFCVFSVEFF